VEVCCDGVCGTGDSPVVEVPYVEWRAQGADDRVDREREGGGAEWITLLHAAARQHQLAVDVEGGRRAVGLIGQGVYLRRPLADLCQEDVAANGVEGVLDVDLHEDDRAGLVGCCGGGMDELAGGVGFP